MSLTVFQLLQGSIDQSPLEKTDVMSCIFSLEIRSARRHFGLVPIVAAAIAN
jgi:hypothetical protein